MCFAWGQVRVRARVRVRVRVRMRVRIRVRIRVSGVLSNVLLCDSKNENRDRAVDN